MTECTDGHEFTMTPETGNYMAVARCDGCGGVLGASFAEAILNEHAALKREIANARKLLDDGSIEPHDQGWIEDCKNWFERADAILTKDGG